MSSIWAIRRSRTDAKLAGLCAGVAAHWGVDPLLVRVGCALLAISGGIGVVLYLAGWLLIPLEGNTKAPVDDLFGGAARRWPNELWVAAVVLACALVFAAFSSVSTVTIGPVVVIALIWYFGFYRPKRGQSNRPGPSNGQLPSAPPVQSPYAPPAPQFIQHPGPPTPFTEAADAWRRRIEEHDAQAARAGQPSAGPAEWPLAPGRPSTAGWPATAGRVAPPSAPPAPVETGIDDHQAFLAAADPVGLYVEPEPASAVQTLPQPADPSRSRSARRLRLVVLLVLGLALAGLGVASTLGVTVSLPVYLATSLLVIGLGLVAATWFGRARGLLSIGILVAIALLLSHAVTQLGRLPVTQNSNLSYTRLADLPASTSIDTGQLTVDLSKLAVDRDASYRASVDLGNLVVVVPPDTNVVVEYSVDLGSVKAYGTQLRGGSELTGTIPDPDPADATEHTLTLQLTVDAGNVEVRR